MKFKDLYENACREVVESVTSYLKGDFTKSRDYTNINDLIKIFREKIFTQY